MVSFFETSCIAEFSAEVWKVNDWLQTWYMVILEGIEYWSVVSCYWTRVNVSDWSVFSTLEVTETEAEIAATEVLTSQLSQQK